MPCDTRSPQPTYTFAQAVTHTHTHARIPTPFSARVHCFSPRIRPSSYIHSAMEAQPFLDDQKGSRHTQIVRGDGSTRSGGTRAVRPHGAAIAAGGPGSCTAFPCLRPISHTLTAPLSLRPLPLCHNVGARRMWSAGMVFRHYDTMMATRL